MCVQFYPHIVKLALCKPSSLSSKQLRVAHMTCYSIHNYVVGYNYIFYKTYRFSVEAFGWNLLQLVLNYVVIVPAAKIYIHGT